jgi:hypothetical protein
VTNRIFFTKYHITNKCTNCILCISLRLFTLNHIRTLSLLLHVSIAYRLSSSGSVYSSYLILARNYTCSLMLVVWYLVNLQTARCNNKNDFSLIYIYILLLIISLCWLCIHEIYANILICRGSLLDPFVVQLWKLLAAPYLLGLSLPPNWSEWLPPE